MLAGALEHQMLEKVRETGFSERIVGGPDLVPNHLCDGRDSMVRHDHDLHAIVEEKGFGAETLRRGRGSEQSQRE